MRRFADKRVLVMGSGRGIGAAIARRFALEGVRVQLNARGREPSDVAELVAFLSTEEATMDSRRHHRCRWRPE